MDADERVVPNSKQEVRSVDAKLYFLLAQRGAVKLEKVGMKHSTGKSIRLHMCKVLGIKQNSTHDQVLEAIEAKIKEREEELSGPGK